MTKENLEELEIPADAPIVEDIDGSLAVELDSILEETEAEAVVEETAEVEAVAEETETTETVEEEATAETETVETVAEGKEDDKDEKDEDDDSDDEDDDSDDDEDEDDEVDESLEVKLNVAAGELDLSEDIEAIFGGEQESLSEEFKTKATGIFEAAVTAKVNETIALYVEKVNTESSRKFEAAKAELTEALSTKVDEYLNLVVEDWLDANREAVESKLQLKLSESFISGLKTLFEAHYVNTDNLQVDVVKSLSEENDSLNSRLNEQVDANVKLKNAVISERRKRIVEGYSADLSETDKAKFFSLAEGVVFSSSQDFKSRLDDIKEAYFAEAKEEVIVNSVEVDDTEVVTEEVEVKKPKRSSSVDKVLKHLQH
ncbi:prohead core protein [Ochrobactrum phage vB_OspM_OC]|nr:prohead core protein [Ochrobactrum phage vB_OspM_OC]